MSITDSNNTLQVKFLHLIALWCNGSTAVSKTACLGSNPSGATNLYFYDIMIYANEKNRLWNMCQLSIGMLEELMSQIERAKLQNEQFVLDWLDKINELSVKY